ncbi:hypothetical protein Slala04_69810 [Streptomyces lavendulae subsp. lavendulae]|nr:hypothetical protein Slala04_69810 [Streptomyces lavendulae subsp. lavendulae]
MGSGQGRVAGFGAAFAAVWLSQLSRAAGGGPLHAPVGSAGVVSYLHAGSGVMPPLSAVRCPLSAVRCPLLSVARCRVLGGVRPVESVSELPECRYLLAGEPPGVALVGRLVAATLTC